MAISRIRTSRSEDTFESTEPQCDAAQDTVLPTPELITENTTNNSESPIANTSDSVVTPTQETNRYPQRERHAPDYYRPYVGVKSFHFKCEGV